jgi:hypothetical protein
MILNRKTDKKFYEIVLKMQRKAPKKSMVWHRGYQKEGITDFSDQKALNQNPKMQNFMIEKCNKAKP